MIMAIESAVKQGASAEQPKIIPADLSEMSIPGQLLLAHILEENNPEMLLFEDDPDAYELRATGWLMWLPCSTAGFIGFKIKPKFWTQLRSLRTTFLTKDLLSALKAYRKRKSAAYPWTWW